MTSERPARTSIGRGPSAGGGHRQSRARGTEVYSKPPLSHTALVQRMRSRGLLIPDAARAVRYLQQVGYYRLSPYMIPFQGGPGRHEFQPGTTFDDVLSLYVFDRQLRLLVMDGLERIEVAVRAGLTDHMSTTSGDPHWYLRDQYFRSRDQHVRLLCNLRTRAEEQLGRVAEAPGDALSYPSALEHYLTRYGEPELPPSWVMVEELTIGQLEKTVANLIKQSDQRAIASALGINDVLLRSWLRTYVRVRNICAHHGRLWNRGLGVYPALPTSRHVNWLQDKNVLLNQRHAYRQHRLYPVLVSIASIMMTISPGSSWRSRLVQLLGQHPDVPLRAMGMPDGWAEDPFWN